MVFSSPHFLFVFGPLSLLVCHAALRYGGKTAYLWAIFAVSAFFYYWSAGRDAVVLVALVLGNFLAAQGLDGPRGRWVFPVTIIANLSVLAWFKYAGFIAANVDALFGIELRARLGERVLPAGVSFFVFQAISYVVDVRRGQLVADRSLATYGAYQAFFPHLIAGPIVRYRDIVADLRRPQLSLASLGAGASRFAHGLAKKVIVADGVAPVANSVFEADPGELSCAAAWLGAGAYSTQIYFDFSGYSDMAIGLALLFGVRFHENFDRPYGSASVTEFWRRWHISLSSWFRDYVYIPLGGSRGGALQTHRNLLLVFALTGMWHGAAWSFLAWGLFHGAFLVLERLGFGEPTKVLRHPALRFAYCLPVVVFGWVLFRASSLPRALVVWERMVSVTDGLDLPNAVRTELTPHACIALTIGLCLCLAPRQRSLGSQLVDETTRPTWRRNLEFAYTAAALAICAVLTLSGSFSPFLYFSF